MVNVTFLSLLALSLALCSRSDFAPAPRALCSHSLYPHVHNAKLRLSKIPLAVFGSLWQSFKKYF